MSVLRNRSSQEPLGTVTRYGVVLSSFHISLRQISKVRLRLTHLEEPEELDRIQSQPYSKPKAFLTHPSFKSPPQNPSNCAPHKALKTQQPLKSRMQIKQLRDSQATITQCSVQRAKGILRIHRGAKPEKRQCEYRVKYSETVDQLNLIGGERLSTAFSGGFRTCRAKVR